MTPAEFMEQLDEKIAEAVKVDDYQIQSIADRTTKDLRNKVLGIEVDNWGKVTHVNDGIVADLLEAAKPELEIFRQKVKDRVKARAHRIDQYPFKRTIDSMLDTACRDIIREEVKGVEAGVNDFIRARIGESLEEWKALVRMQETIQK